MYLLNLFRISSSSSWFISNLCIISLDIFEVQACQNHACIVETHCSTLVDFYLAFLFLVVPHTRLLIFRAGHKRAISRIQVNWRDWICVANERTQNVVVVEGPIHDSIVGVAFARRQYTLVMVRKFDQINAVAFRVVRIHPFTSFQIKKRDWKVVATCNKVLSIMRNVNTIYFLFLCNNWTKIGEFGAKVYPKKLWFFFSLNERQERMGENLRNFWKPKLVLVIRLWCQTMWSSLVIDVMNSDWVTVTHHQSFAVMIQN